MILVGCPVYKREWILPYWFDRVFSQDYPIDQLGFVFVCSRDDKETLDVLFEAQASHPEIKVFNITYVDTTHDTWREPMGDRLYMRRWTQVQALERMVKLRNALLQQVRLYEPTKFFSLDSDILLDDPKTITKLDHYTNQYDAVNSWSYMSDSTRHPSVMNWKTPSMDAAFRVPSYPAGKLFEADVIMASIMMNPKAYNVDYTFNRQGEDLAWSAKVTSIGCKLACAGDIYSAHLLSRKMLDLYLLFGDGRKSTKLWNEG